MPRLIIALFVIGAASLLSSTVQANPEPRRFGLPWYVIEANRIAGSNVIPVAPGNDMPVELDSAALVEFEIGPSGDVVKAEVLRASGIPPETALEAVRNWRFRPFFFNGSPGIAVGTARVELAHPGTWADPAAPFPEVDYESLVITLERSACFGTCPEYRVEIRGTGEVVFASPEAKGEVADAFAHAFHVSGVLAPGRHVSQISRAEVVALVARFREARFFGLKDAYRASATDSPTYKLTFESSQTRKTVEDYLGERAGMPKLVRDLQDEVDRVAGTRRWVTGDSTTVAALASEGFDFSSTAAQRLLLIATSRAPEEVILEMMGRGIPLEAIPLHSGQRAAEYFPEFVGRPLGEMILEHTLRFHRPTVFAELARQGWLKRMPLATLSRSFAESGAGCSADVARALVKAGVDPAVQGRWGRTTLKTALEHCWHGTDRHALVSALVQLGVPLETIDERGQTPIYHADTYELVTLLLNSGARANVKDERGLSPAFSTRDDRALVSLLDAGADPSGEEGGMTLRDIARKRNLPATIAWLDAHQIP